MSELQKLSGRYRCVVENTEHPEGFYLVQVRVLGLWDDMEKDALPWAEYELELGARYNSGDVCPVEVGDLVWVVFEHDDTRAPIITGACAYAPNKVPNLPHEAIAGPEAYQHKRSGNEPKPDKAEYHKNKVLSLNGVLIELEKSGAYRITQKASGTAIEIAKSGQVVIHGESDVYVSAVKDLLMKAGGKIGIEAGGQVDMSGSKFAWVKK